MARFRYHQNDRFDAKFDPTRCAEAVSEPGRGVRIHQCLRRRWNDTEWCKTHHPDTEAAKKAERFAAYQQKKAADEHRKLIWGYQCVINNLKTGAMSRGRAEAIEFLEAELQAMRGKENGAEATDTPTEG